MNNKIREAAQKFVNLKFETSTITKQEWEAYIEGATFALKEMEQLREAAKAVLDNLEREDEPMLMENLRTALSATESYFEIDKTLKDEK